MSRILVIGGYGGFGARLCRRLVAAGHHVIVAGRDGQKAALFCSALPGSESAVVDRTMDLGPTLSQLNPDIVIDAAGPFQNADYAVPRACIAHGCAYLDLADSTAFVCGIAELDSAAREAGVAVISGASSVPALSGPVVRRLAERLDRVSQVEIALSATTKSTATKSVTGAILSYAGKPVRLMRGGRWTSGFGASDLRRRCFVVDGVTALPRRWVALCDVPDLQLLPEILPGRPSVIFRAGSDRAPQILGLWMSSLLVRLGLLRSLSPFRGLFLALQKATMWSKSRRSAMDVRLLGWRGHDRVERTWTLIAEDECGPEIPTLAAAILADRISAGGLAAGARDASCELQLEDFEPAFHGLPLRHQVRERVLPPTLYRRAMGAAFDRLPLAVREMHELNGDAGAAGEGGVTRGNGILARMLGRIMRFPPPGSYPVHVSFAERNGVETWTRDFGGYRFHSVLSFRAHGLSERFGPPSFDFDLPSDETGLRMVLRGWRFFGLPMPKALAPRIAAREWEEDGRFQFDVEASYPILGRIVAYRGSLTPSWKEEEEPSCSEPIRHAAGSQARC